MTAGIPTPARLAGTAAPSAPVPLPAGTDVPYRLRMLSDWHAGSGTGRPGDVDRLVVRDEDRFPYVPAKTLTGVWRDACEVAARALDGGTAGSWAAWVEVVFGGQRGKARPAALSVRRARYSAAMRETVAAEDGLRSALTFLKPGVKIDEVSGRAETGLLRFEEQARVGSVLVGTLRVDVDEAWSDEESRRLITGLLLAGSCLLEQIGGRRRRGSGRCVLELPTVPGYDAWWDWLVDAEPPPPPAASSMPAWVIGRAGEIRAADGSQADRADGGRPGGSRADHGWEVARLRLLLDDPLLCRGRTIGNEVVGLDHMPGATLLPHVLRRLGQAAADALLGGDLIVTHATVAIGEDRGLPTPFTFVQARGGRSPDGPREIVNRLTSPAPDSARPLRDGYVAPGPPLRRVRPDFVVRTHNVIDDASQRPTREAAGGIYTYRALPAGTVLAAEVRVRAGLLPPRWWAALPGRWSVGMSRKDDYGRVTVTADPGAAPAARPVTGRRLSMWLTSELLLLDDRLRPTTDPEVLCRELGDALGVPPGALRGPVHEKPDRIETALAGSRTDSWQRRWGLPRASLSGFAAGGVATFELAADVALDPARVAAVETAGLGERTGEGFGQVLLWTGTPGRGPEILGLDEAVIPARPDPPEASTRPAGATTAPLAPAPAGPVHTAPAHSGRASGDGLAGLDGADSLFLATLRRDAWRTRIHAQAELIAAGPYGYRTVFGAEVDQVGLSQLAALRDVLAVLDDPPAVRALLELLDDENRRRRWTQSVVDRTRLLLTSRDLVWEVLRLDRPETDPALAEELWAEAVRAMVQHALRALRRARERPDPPGLPSANTAPSDATAGGATATSSRPNRQNPQRRNPGRQPDRHGRKGGR